VVARAARAHVRTCPPFLSNLGQLPARATRALREVKRELHSDDEEDAGPAWGQAALMELRMDSADFSARAYTYVWNCMCICLNVRTYARVGKCVCAYARIQCMSCYPFGSGGPPTLGNF